MRLLSKLFVLSLPIIWMLSASAQENDADTDSAEDSTEEDAATAFEVPEGEIEEMVVTGTRLQSSESTARIETITAEDISTRGFGTVEDIVRSIPQNMSTINSQNNLNFGSDVVDTNLGALGAGNATVNLRGFGSANTLVLVDGKRLASHTSEFANFATNIRDIPAAAIERVDIMLDGGSAVYGSDAIGGVINIILKKDYSGGSFKVMQEIATNEGNQTRVQGTYGHSWNSGNATFTFSNTTSEPVNSHKAGYDTRDHSDRFNGDQLWNFYDVVYDDVRNAKVTFSRFDNTGVTADDNQDGTNYQPSDFHTVTYDDLDLEIATDGSGTTDDQGLALAVKQSIFNDRGQVSATFSRNTSFTSTKRTSFGSASLVVPETNAFNQFGQAVWVAYNPSTEIEQGVISPPEQINNKTSDRLVIGLDWTVSDRVDFSLNYLNSEAKGNTKQTLFGARQSLDLYSQTVQDRIAVLLASPDPNVAVNVFGNGTAQNATIAELVVPVASESGTSTVSSWEGFFKGTVMDVPGGELSFAAGMEFREEGTSDVSYYTPTAVEDKVRKVTAWFAELSWPVVGPGNAIAGVEGLTLSFQLRNDTYRSEGADGFDENGTRNIFKDDIPNWVKSKYENLGPRLGAKWTINSDWYVVASYSEAFKAPSFSDLYGTSDVFPDDSIYDALCACFVVAHFEYGSNPDIKPERSDNYSLGVKWTPQFLPNFAVEGTYSVIDMQDRIASPSELRSLLPIDVFAYLPFFTRDADGNLLSYVSRAINVSRRVNDSFDLNVQHFVDAGGFGSVSSSLAINYVIAMYDRALDKSPNVPFRDELNGVDRYKINGKMIWEREDKRLNLNLIMGHTPSYVNNSFTHPFGKQIPLHRIGSRTVFDLTSVYRMDNGVTIRGGARNLFNRGFPFAISRSGIPYDAARVDLRGRIWFFELGYDFERG